MHDPAIYYPPKQIPHYPKPKQLPHLVGPQPVVQMMPHTLEAPDNTIRMDDAGLPGVLSAIGLVGLALLVTISVLLKK